MNRVRILDKEFVEMIPSGKIQDKVSALGNQISDELKGEKPLFMVVLNGAFHFAADLIKNISIECETTFVRVASYSGTDSGQVKTVNWFADEIKGRTVVLIEDIIDTGKTLVYLLDEIKKHDPKEIRIVSLLNKQEVRQHEIKADYTGFEVPNKFLVGYGLDYNGLGRNLSDIYEII